MRRNNYLANADYRAAVDSPLKLIPRHSDNPEAQYFVDLLRDEVRAKLGDAEEEARNIYTTLDPDLQEAARAAVNAGMEKVDKLLRKRKDQAVESGQPQVALVALDPRTGEVKALVGGRSYTASQLNHAIAMRQPGSVFKPFVYAAALSTALEHGSQPFTPASILNDEPTTFRSGGEVYQPGNFHHELMGDVTLRDALTQSLNIPTVSLAEKVGYKKVVQTARRAGFNDGVKPTPALALGAYETTPLEIASAYTTFANQGVHVKAALVSEARAANGRVLYQHKPETGPALDPRVNFLMVSILQDVLNRGTGAGVRGLGFTLPAAGKTGTSRDGWFAGFTSELLCVVWVGFDDNRDLGLTGGAADAPIWADFMMKATSMSPYRDVKDFAMPDGVQSVVIDPESLQLATANCPTTREEVYVAGSAPTEFCELHGGHGLATSTGSVLSQIFGGQTKTPDRKSTRLNSSHTVISYAVFCLKKKKLIS